MRSPAIGVDGASRGDSLLDETMQVVSRRIGDLPEANSANASPIFFGGNHNERFTPSISGMSSWRDATDEGFVNFDSPDKALSPRPNHGPAQLVQPTPSRFVTAQSQDALNAQGAGTGLLAGDQPGCTKPDLQGQMRPLKDRTSSDSGLTATRLAGPTMTSIYPACFSLAAGADESCRPA